MNKKYVGSIALISSMVLGLIIYSEQSMSEDGNPSQWSMNCFHHGTFVGVSNNLIGCLNQVPESQKTHANPLDCITTAPFN